MMEVEEQVRMGPSGCLSAFSETSPHLCLDWSLHVYVLTAPMHAPIILSSYYATYWFGRQKGSFEFFCNILQKNPNEFFGQPYILPLLPRLGAHWGQELLLLPYPHCAV